MKRLLLLIAVTLTASAQTEKPLTSFPYTPGLDVTSMDKNAGPCVDFYQYSCGGWMKNNPIPADQPRWSVYGKLYQDNQQFLWGILDQLSKQTSGRNANQQKIGDYFGACMDEATVNKLGAKPLQPYLDQIAAMQSTKDLPALLAGLHTSLQTGGLFFNFGSNQDYENSQNVIAFAEAGGLGLPDRDYYTKTDEKSVDIRNKYVVHVQKMFELLGDKPDVAKAEAAKVMEIETALAKASLTRVERRDPYKLFHKVDFKGLQAMTPDFDWSIYIKDIGLPAQNTFMRFKITWRSRYASPTTASASSVISSHSISKLFCCAVPKNVFAASSVHLRREKGCCSNWTRPASNLEKSKISLTVFMSEIVQLSTVLRFSFCSGVSSEARVS